MQSVQSQFTVLIVDDTFANVLILKKTLINSGYHVLSADNGAQGRLFAEEQHPDLILLDIMMPGEDGFETITKLKNNPKTASIPVIFLTALSDVDAKIKGFELGAVDFITKPFHPAEIRARVRLHIRLSIGMSAMIQVQAEKLKQVSSAQQALLVNPLDMPDAKFDVFYASLNEAGGDFYDVINISDSIYGYFVSDVSGHDVATGFLTAALKALLRQNCSPVYSAVESMTIINKVLIDVLPTEKYLTACYITINRKMGKVSVVNMGHPLAIYHDRANDKFSLVETESDVLGAFDDVLYNELDLKVNPGDRIYLYTDGLVENGDDVKVWGGAAEKVLDAFQKAVTGASIKDTITSVKSLLLPSAAESQTDDVIIMGIEI